jgi:hypothetical protein
MVESERPNGADWLRDGPRSGSMANRLLPPGFWLSNQLQTPVGKQWKGFSTCLGKGASTAAWIALESV